MRNWGFGPTLPPTNDLFAVVIYSIYNVWNSPRMLAATELEAIDDEIWELYQSAFNEIEKVPRQNLERVFGRGASLVEYRDEGRFIGFTYSFMDRDMLSLLYFATVPEARGKGYGAQILGLMRSAHPDMRMFVVLEPLDKAAEDYSLRARRHEFYRRNGCGDTGVFIISDGAPFELMFIQGELSEKEMNGLLELYEDIHNGRV